MVGADCDYTTERSQRGQQSQGEEYPLISFPLPTPHQVCPSISPSLHCSQGLHTATVASQHMEACETRHTTDYTGRILYTHKIECIHSPHIYLMQLICVTRVSVGFLYRDSANTPYILSTADTLRVLCVWNACWKSWVHILLSVVCRETWGANVHSQ